MNFDASISMNFVIGSGVILVVVQLGIIYALVNRLMAQSGMPRMRPTKPIEDAVAVKTNEKPAAKGKVVGGSQKVNL